MRQSKIIIDSLFVQSIFDKVLSRVELYFRGLVRWSLVEVGLNTETEVHKEVKRSLRLPFTWSLRERKDETFGSGSTLKRLVYQQNVEGLYSISLRGYLTRTVR